MYPTERLTVAAFVREQINYKSTFQYDGVFIQDPTGAGCGGGVSPPACAGYRPRSLIWKSRR